MSESLEQMQKELVQLKVRRAYNKARQQRLSSAPDPSLDPTAGMSGVEKFMVGNTSGWDEGLRGAVNLALPDSLTPEWASDKRLGQIHHDNEALKRTGAGMAGNILGSVASTSPVGGGSVAGTRAVGNVLAKTLAAGGKLNAGQRVARAATSLPVRGAVEGATTSAIMASPDQQGESANVGALVGGGMGVGGKILGRAIQGIAKKSPETLNTEFLALQKGENPFVPIAYAVGDKADFTSRIVKAFYKEALPYIPGVTGQMKAQARSLGDTFRSIALKEADHFDVLKNHKGILEHPAQAVQILRKSVTDGFDAIKKLTYKIKDPQVRANQINAELRRKFPDMDAVSINKLTEAASERLHRFADGGLKISGNNLLNAKNSLRKMYKTLEGPEKAALGGVLEQIETLIKQATPQKLLEKYLKAQAAHPDVKALENALGNRRTFSPTELINAAGKKAPNMSYVGENFDATMKGNIGLPGAAGRFMSRGATGPVTVAGATGAGLVLNPMITGAVLGGANVLATRPVQRALMGSTKSQQALIKALRSGSNEERAQILGSLGRAGVTTQFGER